MSQERSFSGQLAFLPYFALGLLQFLFAMILGQGLLATDNNDRATMVVSFMLVISLMLLVWCWNAGWTATDRRRFAFMNDKRKLFMVLIASLGCHSVFGVMWFMQTELTSGLWTGAQGAGGLFFVFCVTAGSALLVVVCVWVVYREVYYLAERRLLRHLRDLLLAQSP